MSINRVIPYLYIGDVETAKNMKALKANGITHILQVMGGMSPVFPKKF